MHDLVHRQHHHHAEFLGDALESLRGRAVGDQFSCTAIILFGRAGELVRPYLISVKEKVTFSSQLAAWVIERICDLLAALLIFGLRAGLGGTVRSKGRPGAAMDAAVWAATSAPSSAYPAFSFSCALSRSSGGACAATPRRPGRPSRTLANQDPRLPELVQLRRGMHPEPLRRTLAGCLHGPRVGSHHLVLYGFLSSFSSSDAGLGLTDVVILMGFVSFGAVGPDPRNRWRRASGGGAGADRDLRFAAWRWRRDRTAALANYICSNCSDRRALLVHEGLNWRRLKAMRGRQPM